MKKIIFVCAINLLCAGAFASNFYKTTCKWNATSKNPTTIPLQLPSKSSSGKALNGGETIAKDAVILDGLETLNFKGLQVAYAISNKKLLNDYSVNYNINALTTNGDTLIFSYRDIPVNKPQHILSVINDNLSADLSCLTEVSSNPL